jgi:hypothetical protein
MYGARGYTPMNLWRTAIFAAAICAIAAWGAQVKQHDRDLGFHGSNPPDEAPDRIGCWVDKSDSLAIHQRRESVLCSDY